jgi:uncharacterized protein YjbI with pentapeptide repeats
MSEPADQPNSACPHPEAVGTRWGDPISEERQAELQGMLDAWAAPGTNHGNRKGPFDTVRLTGADVFWLTELLRQPLPIALSEVHLEGANLNRAHLEGAYLRAVHFEGARLIGAHLEKAQLIVARLQGANLGSAHLEQAILITAHLEGAHLHATHLEGAELFNAHLERAILVETHLERANLRRVTLDSGTSLEDAILAQRASLRDRLLRRNTSAALGDIHWGSLGTVDLTNINWDAVRRLGEEDWRERGFRDGIEGREAVVRAYRQLAAQLRAQGMSEITDRFLYRAQVCQRRVHLRRFHIHQYLGSWFLDLVSGYGYKPMRSFLTYLLVVLGFAAAYFALGGASGKALSWNEAIVVSMTAFHGRGFFAAVFQPGDPQAAVAAIEAVIGLLIEITFIATFTNRFFAR